MKIVLIGDSLFNKEGISVGKKLIEECSNADLVLMNVEGPITNAPPQKKEGSALATRPDNIDLLLQLNVSVAILGNNHIMDHGKQGLTDTKNILAEKNIKYVGAGNIDNEITRPYVTEYKGVAIFSFTHQEGPMYGEEDCGPIGLPDTESVIKEIKEYKKNDYKVIFNYHGGEEYFTVPWPRRRGFLRRISNAGADIVFAHHSHSVQPIEIIDGKVIVYSPGNFYMDTSNQRKNKGTDTGFVTIIEEGKVITQKVKVNRKEKRLNVSNYAEFSLMTDIILSENEINQKWINECKRYFTKPIKNANMLMNIKVMVQAYRFLYFVKTTIRLKKKERNMDILISAIPVIGSIYVKSLYGKGVKKFKF